MKQTIDVNYLKGLKPCEARLNEFLKNYPTFSGSYSDFLDLENVSYDDKIWVSKRFLSINQLVHFGILCADSVAHIYNDKYPDDKRISDLLNYLKSIPDFTKITVVQKDEIWALRRAAYAAADAAAYA